MDDEYQCNTKTDRAYLEGFQHITEGVYTSRLIENSTNSGIDLILARRYMVIPPVII